MARAVSEDFKTSLPNYLCPCSVFGLFSGDRKFLRISVAPIGNFGEASICYRSGNNVRAIRTAGERRSRVMSAILGRSDDLEVVIWRVLQFLTVILTAKRRNLFAVRLAACQRRERRHNQDFD